MPPEADTLDTHLEAQSIVTGSPHGHTIRVTIIRPGTSNNGNAYSAQVLRQSVPLWAGVPAYCDHATPADAGRPGGRSVRDLVGTYADPRYDDTAGLVADLHLYPPSHWVADLVSAHIEECQRNPAAAGRLGLSADILVDKTQADPPARWRVIRIVQAKSADIVVNPSAGGSLDAIIEGATMKPQVAATTEATQPPNPESPPTTTPDPTAALRASLLEARTASLPPSARAAISRRLSGSDWSAADLDAEVAVVRAIISETSTAHPVTGNGTHRPAIVTSSPRVNMQAALDRLFGLKLPDSMSHVPRFSGIREAYIAFTGDRLMTGRYALQDTVLEANEVTTTILSDALTDTLSKRLVADYNAQALWWKPIVVESSVPDLRLATRVLMSDFASLPTVAEGGAYVNLAWGDTKETFTPLKKGSQVQVTMEAILADDLRSISRIPSKLATAAAHTINELISALFTVNAGLGPTMTDTFTVFQVANHANTGTTALAAAELTVVMVAIAKQINSASKRLALRGRYLLVPVDLMNTARVLCESTGLPGSPNNDINVVYGQLVPIVVPNWTDTNNWYVLADPVQIESIEVAYLNGRKEPELLLQDSPTAGAVFTNDYISWKVRHIYGAVWLDYRGAYGEVVA